MTAAFLHLSGVGQGVLCTLLLLLLCGGLCAAILAFLYRTPASRTALCLLPALANFAVLGILMNGMALRFSPAHAGALERALWSAPAWTLALSGAVWAVWILHAMLRLLDWRRSHISGTSIKESLDQLPSGLCFYAENGLPRLVNVRMEALCRVLTGAPLMNGAVFWQRLAAGDVLPENRTLQTCDAPIVQSADGRVWSFSNRRINAGGEAVVQLIAADITREHAMNAELAADNFRLTEMNRRLRRYGARIRELTRERETLAAKLRIHDEFGQALLAARRLTEVPGDAAQRAEVLRLWRQNLALMEGAGSAAVPGRDFDELIAAARAIGVTVTVEGEFGAADASCMALLENAAHECLTNTVRHARGTLLRVHLSQAQGRITAVFTNDGAAPQHAVTEGGGLSSLRRRVEDAGGCMRIASAPRFALTVELPLESEEWT